jgi:hypothetical protein
VIEPLSAEFRNPPGPVVVRLTVIDPSVRAVPLARRRCTVMRPVDTPVVVVRAGVVNTTTGRWTVCAWLAEVNPARAAVNVGFPSAVPR